MSAARASARTGRYTSPTRYSTSVPARPSISNPDDAANHTSGDEDNDDEEDDDDVLDVGEDNEDAVDEADAAAFPNTIWRAMVALQLLTMVVVTASAAFFNASRVASSRSDATEATGLLRRPPPLVLLLPVRSAPRSTKSTGCFFGGRNVSSRRRADGSDGCWRSPPRPSTFPKMFFVEEDEDDDDDDEEEEEEEEEVEVEEEEEEGEEEEGAPALAFFLSAAAAMAAGADSPKRRSFRRALAQPEAVVASTRSRAAACMRRLSAPLMVCSACRRVSATADVS